MISCLSGDAVNLEPVSSIPHPLFSYPVIAPSISPTMLTRPGTTAWSRSSQRCSKSVSAHQDRDGFEKNASAFFAVREVHQNTKEKKNAQSFFAL